MFVVVLLILYVLNRNKPKLRPLLQTLHCLVNKLKLHLLLTTLQISSVNSQCNWQDLTMLGLVQYTLPCECHHYECQIFDIFNKMFATGVIAPL